ncbi:hypothetical protein HYH02_002297 [Chlamydomonas schloesseri]|uniref:Uncharacterized protein n=1 Tax=Chlamydomonas schloesseri TaxID=2026947 RepID=A0A836BBG6_9CHLO|nr:hypothetical protein HYH02_002297 [Chlamydomonas schloesseri]|eukprot:KAG2452960.1 hypothetical protein HYH02_002297 [Chlamydomonas schloesseri]
MTIPDEKVLTKLRELLKDADLNVTTEKMLRKQLEEHFKQDMTDRKPIIRAEVERYLAEQAGDEEEEEGEESEDDAPARGGGMGSWLSEPLQAFLGVETLPRTQVVKRLWEYIKANNLQDPKDKRKILLDDKLKTLFSSPLTMFTMNTQLSKHVKVYDGDDEKPKAKAGKRPAAKADNEKSKKVKTEMDEEKRKKNAFTKPVRLSPELAALTGKEAMGRPEVTTFFWSYVKEKGLKDPSNGQFILCDAALKKITGEDRIKGFGFMKYFAPHMLKD